MKANQLIESRDIFIAATAKIHNCQIATLSARTDRFGSPKETLNRSIAATNNARWREILPQQRIENGTNVSESPRQFVSFLIRCCLSVTSSFPPYPLSQ